MKRKFPVIGLVLLLVGLAGIGLFRFFTVSYFRPLGSAYGLGRDGNYGQPMLPGLGGRGWGTATGPDIGTDAAKKAATDFVASLGHADLKVADLWKFSGTPYYAQVVEKSTGRGAFEILVDRTSGRVYPEMGPDMLWNLKYGTAWGYGMRWMMGGAGTTGGTAGTAGGPGPGWGGFGMMGPGGPLGSGGVPGTPGPTGGGAPGTTAPTGDDGTTMSVSEADARSRATSFVKANATGMTIGPGALAYYGYYNFTVQSGGKPYGVLSVNGYSGQVWFHAWHGPAEQVVPIG
ncbi:MAG: hypothetical protein ACYC41_08040 [Bacillota bacterium]